MNGTFTFGAVALVASSLLTASAAAQERSENGLRTDMWTRPGHYSWDLTAGVAARSWETSYGGRDPNTTVALSAAWHPTRWLQARVGADFSVKREAPANLVHANTATFVGAGPGLGFWWSLVRFELEGHAGAQMRTVSFDDNSGRSGARTRFDAAFGGSVAVGIGLFGRFMLALRGGPRWYADRADGLIGLHFSWFPGATSEEPSDLGRRTSDALGRFSTR